MKENIKHLGMVLGLSFNSLFIGFITTAICINAMIIIGMWLEYEVSITDEIWYMGIVLVAVLYLSHKHLKYKKQGWELD